MVDQRNKIIEIYGEYHGKEYNTYVRVKGYDKLLRGRSELLIVKGDSVYLQKKTDGGYRIPGGGWNEDEDHAQAAIREAQEEARITAKYPIYQGSYIKKCDPPKWMKEKFTEDKWTYGYFSEIYVAEYDKKYTGFIAEADKDDMYKYGKFYPLDEAIQFVDERHIDILKSIKMKKLNFKSAEAQENFMKGSVNMGDDKEFIPNINHMDEILMMSADEIIDGIASEALIEVSDIEDDDLCDIDELVGEEGLKIIEKYHEAKNKKAEEKAKQEEERKTKELIQKGITKLDSLKSYDPDNKRNEVSEAFANYSRSSTDLRRDTPIRKKAYSIWYKHLLELQSANGKFTPGINTIINDSKSLIMNNPENYEEIIKDAMSKIKAHIDKKYKEINLQGIINNLETAAKSARVTPKELFDENNSKGRLKERENNAKMAGVTESAVDVAVVAGAIGTIGYWLYKNILAVKKERPYTSGRQNAYYYILSNEFKKSEKALDKILNGRKRFLVSKPVLDEAVSFRKKYYNCVAMIANKFMESYESMKDLIGKEKSYVFTDSNPVRDKALINKLTQCAKPMYEMKHGNFYQNAVPILNYEVEYTADRNTNKIVIDGSYLENLLNPKETYRIIRELDGIIAKIPPVESATKYEDLIVKTSDVSSPLNCYIGIMYDLRELAEKVLGIVNAYVYVVYSVLDYAIIANEKNIRTVQEDLSSGAFEGFIKDLKVAGIINANKAPDKSAHKHKEENIKSMMQQTSEDIKKIGGNIALKSKIAVLEKMYKEYESTRKKNGYSIHPSALKDTARSIFLSGKHETISQLIHNKKDPESLTDNMLYRDLGILITKIDELCRVDCGNEAASAAIAEATYLRSLINECHADIAVLNEKEAKILLHYFNMRFQVLSAYIVFSAAEIHPEKFEN